MLRILSISEPARNDVIALITDGEEIGMIGAQAFFERHPWAEDVGVVLNLEARGCGGVTYMYETGPDNHWLIRAFAAGAANPVANSLNQAIYRRMPNDSDFTHAKSAALPGLNFAFIDGWHVYHTPLDDPRHLNLASLYHLGSGAFQVLKRLADIPIDSPPPGDAVYFNLWRPWLISYPMAWVNLLAAVVALLLLGTLVFGRIKGQIYGRGIAAGFIGWLAAAGLVMGAAYLLRLGARVRFGDRYPEISRYPDFRNLALAAALGLAFLIFLLVFGTLRRRFEGPSLAAGALLWCALGAGALTYFLPGGSCLLIWPLLFAVISLWLVWAGEEPAGVSPWRSLVIGLLALPALIQLSMTFWAFNTAFAFLPLSLLIPGLMLGLLFPAWTAVPQSSLRKAGLLFLLPALAAVGYGLWAPGWDTRPSAQHVYYRQTSNGAVLSVTETTPWAAAFMAGGAADVPDLPLMPGGKILSKPVNSVLLPPPRLESRQIPGGPDVMNVELSVKSARLAPRMVLRVSSSRPFTLRIEETGERLFSAVRNDLDSDAERPHRMLLFLFALPPEGAEFLLEANGSGPVEVVCADITDDLPSELGLPAPSAEILLHPRSVVSTRISLVRAPNR
jgi:hypothetical protein